jgi:hypothetical protein
MQILKCNKWIYLSNCGKKNCVHFCSFIYFSSGSTFLIVQQFEQYISWFLALYLSSINAETMLTRK